MQKAGDKHEARTARIQGLLRRNKQLRKDGRRLRELILELVVAQGHESPALKSELKWALLGSRV